MKRYKSIYRVIAPPVFLLLLLTMRNSAQAEFRRSVGTSSAQFLKLPVNARAIALGESYSSIADESDAIYWNPAGLYRVKNKSISLMHALYLDNIYYDFGSYSQRIGDFGALGVGVQYLGAGSITQVDESNSDVGTYKPHDWALSVGWAHKLTDFGSDQEFLVGFTGKFIQSRIIETAATGAADVGLMWSPVKRVWVGVTAQNLGPALKFKNEGGNLPATVRVGSSYKIFEPKIEVRDKGDTYSVSDAWIASMDMIVTRDNNPIAALGTEYKHPVSTELIVSGRIGYNSRTATDIRQFTAMSMGIGLDWQRFCFDFAWVPFGELGQSYRFSITKRF